MENTLEEIENGVFGKEVSRFDEIDTHFGGVFHLVISKSARDQGICAFRNRATDKVASFPANKGDTLHRIVGVCRQDKGSIKFILDKIAEIFQGNWFRELSDASEVTLAKGADILKLQEGCQDIIYAPLSLSARV